MRKINGKLFLGLLLGGAVCTGAVFGVHHFQYRRIADSLLWQARRAEEQGEVERQARYLQRYLEFNPRDDDEKAHLAQLWGSEAFAGAIRERSRAVRLLDEVLTRDSERPELRRLLVKLALEVGSLKMARNHLEKLLPEKQMLDAAAEPAGAADRDRGEIEGYWGQLFEAENKTDEAIACCRLAVGHAPDIVASSVRLAYLLRRHKEADPARATVNIREADAVIDALVKNNPKPHDAYLARWRYRREFDLLDLKGTPAAGQVALNAAAEDVAAALERAPQVVEVLLAAADMERLLGQAAFDAAGTPQEKDARLRQHRDRAYKFLRDGLELHAKRGKRAANNLVRFQLLWHKANLLLDDLKQFDDPNAERGEQTAEQKQARIAEVAGAIEDIRKTRGWAPAPAAADYLQGRLLLLDRRWGDAATLFEQVRPTLGGQADIAAQINLFLGQCYEQLDSPGQMFNAYHRLLEADPTSVAALLGMATAEWSVGRLDNAAAKYRQLVTRRQVPDKVWLDIARLEIQRQAQQDEPNWPGVEQLLDTAKKANPKSLDVPLLTAQMWVARKDVKKAAKVLEEAKTAHPDAAELWTAQATLALRDKDPDTAKKTLDEADRKFGDRVLLRLARARWIAEKAAKEDAEAALQRLAEGVEKFKPDEQATLLSGLADALLSLDHVEAARNLWRRVAAMPGHQNDLRLRLLLFDLAVKLKREDDMKQALEDIRAVERGQGAFHHYGEALRLIWVARQHEKEPEKARPFLDNARLQLDRVQLLRPGWPPVFLARAEIDILNESPDQAILNLQEAIRHGETSPAVIHQLVGMLAKRGRHTEADEALKHLREPLLANSELGQLATYTAVGQKDIKRARKLLDKAVPSNSRNFRDVIWRGQMLAVQNEPVEAEKELRRAIGLAAAEPEPYVALVQFLARQKDREADADKVILDAKAKLPPEKADLAVAQCYEALGKKKDARESYQVALDGHRQDAAIVRRVAEFHWNAGQYPEAEKLLREIVEKKVVDPSPADVSWARYHLALVLGTGTDFGRFREALSLVELKLDSEGKLVRGRDDRIGTDMQRYQARVLALQPGQRQFRQRAVELLEGLERSKALRPDDRFILAMLYEADKAWAKARLIFADLVRDPAPRHLAHYTQSLIEHNQLDEAERQVDRLEALEKQRASEPNAFAAIELRARLLEARDTQGGAEKALKLLRQHIQRKNAKPEEVLLLLTAMRRQKKYADAFALCEKTWEEGRCDPEVVGGVSVALLRALRGAGNAATEAQVTRLEDNLKQAIQQANSKRHPSVVLLLHLADLYDQRGRYAEAEAIYRKVLLPDNEPRNVVALNNLAWLLAQRSGDTGEALKCIESAVNGIGRRADLLDTRGLVHLALGEQDAALRDFREASAEMPSPTHLYHLARVHHKIGDRAAAHKILSKARDDGLQAKNLHPIEQEECRKLMETLKVQSLNVH